MINLEEIKARADKATKGRWASIDSQFVIEPNGDGVCQTFDCDTGLDYPNHENNLEFIAAAHQDVPALVAEVERLRLSFAFQCHIGNLSLAQTATALDMSQTEVMELTRKLPSPDSHRQGNGGVE